MITANIPDAHVWLRITRPEYLDPFDPTFAQRVGGRWNPPQSWPTLYLNHDLTTVHAQVRHMFTGRGIEPGDLADDAPIRLAACTLPRRQTCADAVHDEALGSLGLPVTYPLATDGGMIEHSVTQRVGADVHRAGLRGVWCRSAAGAGRELAWFPAPRSSARAVWSAPKQFGEWRSALTLANLTNA